MLLSATMASSAHSAGTAKHGSSASEALAAEISRQAEADYPGINSDPAFRRVLPAIRALDRREFVPHALRSQAFTDRSLFIGYGQTISAPYIVAVMTWAVEAKRGSNILEVGTGSGYQAALLSELGATVHSIEIVPPLARTAARRLRKLRAVNVTVRMGDGFAGWPEFAPYDGVIVTAGSARVPPPLLEQVRIGGRLVMPIGVNDVFEQLVVYTKTGPETFSACSLGPAMFVPLTGKGEAINRPGLYDRTIPLCRHGQTARWPGQPVG